MTDLINPYSGVTFADEETVQALRVGAISELDAINLYQAHLNTIADPEARKLLEHVRDQEKEHLAEFISLIGRMDPDQADYLTSLQESGQTVLPQAVRDIDDLVANFGNELLAGPPIYAQRIDPPSGDWMRPSTAAPESLIPAEDYGRLAMDLTPPESGGSDGYVVDAGLARATKCTRIDLGAGRKPLVYSPGIIGALDEGQEILYCQEGFIEREASEAQLEHIQAMSDAAEVCSTEASDVTDPKSHINAYFTCLGRELAKRQKGG